MTCSLLKLAQLDSAEFTEDELLDELEKIQSKYLNPGEELYSYIA